MTASSLRDVAYHLPWRISGLRLGAHRGRLTGGDQRFRDIVPFMEQPDPRRLAIRQSIVDPFQTTYVRRFEKALSIDVYAAVDVSRSMAFSGNCNKKNVALALVEALSECVVRSQDRFGIAPFSDRIHSQAFIPVTRSRAAHHAAIAKLHELPNIGTGTKGVEELAAILGGSRKLVFLISDFLWRDDEINACVDALRLHDVIPIVIEDSASDDDLPAWGLMRLADLESGQSRLIAVRPSLKKAISERHRKRLATIADRFSVLGRKPLLIRNEIDWGAIAAYLIRGS